MHDHAPCTWQRNSCLDIDRRCLQSNGRSISGHDRAPANEDCSRTTKRMVFLARQFFHAWATRQLTPFSDDLAF